MKINHSPFTTYLSRVCEQPILFHDQCLLGYTLPNALPSKYFLGAPHKNLLNGSACLLLFLIGNMLYNRRIVCKIQYQGNDQVESLVTSMISKLAFLYKKLH